ncbi:MAG: YihY/virulence factor BrkB family protein [Balneolaceae bacterium]
MKKIIYYLREIWALVKDSLASWWAHDPFRSSTVIAYYTIFALPGLGVIIINLAGYFYGTEAITNQISSQIDEMIGGDAAVAVERIIANAYTSQGLTVSSVISLGVLFFGATGVFYQIQQSLNLMWQVEPQPEQQLLKFLTDRLFSFGMILAIGFLLLVSLIISSLISAFSNWLSVSIFGLMNVILKVTDILLSLGIITVLFAAIYKILPDVKIRWKDVWAGAFTASLLFTAAKFLLGLYFGVSNPGSVYGAAGSIILIMLWTTYSGLILLYGAEFTRIYARRYGVKIEPSNHASYKYQTAGEKDI